MSGEVAAALDQLGFVLLVLLTIGAIGWSARRITRRLGRSSRTAGPEAEPSLASDLDSVRDLLRPYPGATRAYRGGLAMGVRILFYTGAMPLGCFTLLAVGAAAGSALMAGFLEDPPVLVGMPSTPEGVAREIAAIGLGLLAAVLLIVVLRRLLLRTGMRALEKGLEVPPEPHDVDLAGSAPVAPMTAREIRTLDATLEQLPREPPDR